MERDKYCYECKGLGNDYYFDDNGELVSACNDCWVNQREENDNGNI